MACGLFSRLTRRLWKKRGIRIEKKIKVFNAMVTSTLLYASVMWTQREEHAKKLESAQYRMAHYMLCVGPTDHVRMTTGYETLGMLPLWVILVNLADVGMGCKACQYGWHPNVQEDHVLPDGQGQETTRQAFHALVEHFNVDPAWLL